MITESEVHDMNLHDGILIDKALSKHPNAAAFWHSVWGSPESREFIARPDVQALLAAALLTR